MVAAESFTRWAQHRHRPQTRLCERGSLRASPRPRSPFHGFWSCLIALPAPSLPAPLPVKESERSDPSPTPYHERSGPPTCGTSPATAPATRAPHPSSSGPHPALRPQQRPTTPQNTTRPNLAAEPAHNPGSGLRLVAVAASPPALRLGRLLAWNSARSVYTRVTQPKAATISAR